MGLRATVGRPQWGLSSVWPLRWELLSRCSSATRPGLSYSSHETATMPGHGPLGLVPAPTLNLRLTFWASLALPSPESPTDVSRHHGLGW